MQAKAIEQEMNSYFMQLSLPEKKSVVQMLKTFLQGRKIEFAPVTIEEYNEDINEAMDEVARGEFYTHDEVVKMSKNW